jgi:stage II sporulation protein GA (sporulation sigma-E factor processing peptidase)
MVVNGDATMAVSWGVDAVVVSVASHACRLPARPWRVMAAAAVGSVPTLLTLLGDPLPAAATAVLVPLAMGAVAWIPVPRVQFWRGVLWLWAAMIVSGGLMAAWVGVGLPEWLGLMGLPVGMWASRRWWTREVERPLRRRRGLVPLKCWLGTRTSELVALWDDGNRLTDPAGGRPVMVVECEAVAPLLDPGLAEWVHRVLQGAADPPPGPWRGRAGLVGVWTATGRRVLPIVAVDHAEVEVDGRWHVLKPLTMGLTDSILSPARQYQAILHPTTLSHRASAGA